MKPKNGLKLYVETAASNKNMNIVARNFNIASSPELLYIIYTKVMGTQPVYFIECVLIFM